MEIREVAPNPPRKTDISRIERWKKFLPNHNGIKYCFYERVDLENLERLYQRHISNGNSGGQNFIKAIGPYYANLVLHVLVEHMEAEEAKKHFDEKYMKLTQAVIGEKIEQLFGKFGYKNSQSAISKALKTLETPFCYVGRKDFVFTVSKSKRESVFQWGDRYEYWITKFQGEFDNKATYLRSKYSKKVALPFSYLINQYYKESGSYAGWVSTGFMYRFKDVNDTTDFKKDLLHSFGEQCFFNVVTYEDNVVILLAQDHPQLKDLSDTLSKLFVD